MNRFFGLVFFLMLSSSANSGLFGPDNYDECLLDKMKGQSKNMRQTVNKICERKFPYEKVIWSSEGNYNYIERDEVRVNWSSSDGRIFATLVNNSEYEITRVTRAIGKVKSCKPGDDIGRAEFPFSLTFYFSSSLESSAALKNAADMNCSYTKIVYGKLRK